MPRQDEPDDYDYDAPPKRPAKRTGLPVWGWVLIVAVPMLLMTACGGGVVWWLAAPHAG